MSDQFLGEIRIFPFNFAPIGWAFCNGQILAISQYAALFSLLGINYGGNGTSTFGLPNLQGCLPVGQGQGVGLSPYSIGQTGGSPFVTLMGSEIASHIHALTADQETATTGNPSGAIYMKGHYKSSTGTQGAVAAYSTLAPDTSLSSGALGLTGGGQPHNNMMPYLTLNFCIALSGEYPARS